MSQMKYLESDCFLLQKRKHVDMDLHVYKVLKQQYNRLNEVTAGTSHIVAPHPLPLPSTGLLLMYSKHAICREYA